MLDPEYLDRAGEMVAGVYRQIEAEMLDYLVGRMLAGDITDQRSLTALELLAQSAAAPLMEIVGRHEADISRAVRLEVTDAIRRCGADDLRRVKEGLGLDLQDVATRQTALTVAGVARILGRDNVDMAEGARRAFLDASAWAVTQVNAGAMTTERALHMAVRRLEREGVSVVQYRDAATGAQTVVNKVDVAVRRHIRTQILQDGMAMTESILDRAGVELVEVSSHCGARPSHAAWQGRVYSRSGERVVDGVRYADFRTACHWGDVSDGIGGANCRHSYSAWFPGMRRLYEPDPPHPSGLPNDEVYRLTQRQRAGERAIRATKRELAGAQALYERSGSLGDMGEVARLKMRLRAQQGRMRDLVAENPKVLQRSPRREWAGDMPKVDVPRPSGRGLDELLEGRAAKAAMAKAGVSMAAARRAVAEEMERRGGELKDFPALTAKEQRGIFDRVMDKLRPAAKPTPRGKHAALFAKIRGEHTPAEDLARTNPNFGSGDRKWTANCQRCVSAYEARRRGYAVTAKPCGGDGDPLPYMLDPHGWPQTYEGGELVPCFGGSGADVRRKVEGLMERWGDGARAIVRVQWRGGHSGHVFIAERSGGVTSFVDPQCNSGDCSDYFESVKTDETYCMRIDNRMFTELIKECCEEER